MITTDCEKCCFLKKDIKGHGCILGQLCGIKDNKVVASGYCRTCRSNKWLRNHDNKDLGNLTKIIIYELALKFDMLLFFDETTNTVADLERTLNSDWYIPYAQKIIIMDTTGFGDRKNLALQYIKSRTHPVKTIVDSCVVHESVYEGTIRRLSRQVESPFFLVISAGNIINNFDKLANMIQKIGSRVIHWSFPSVIGETVVLLRNNGLFITTPYRALIKSSPSFEEQLKIEEEETQMGLSWFCQECWLI